MTAKTAAALALEIADVFRTSVPYPTALVERLSAFLTNLLDSSVNGYLVSSGAGVPVDYTDGTPPATGEGTSPPGALYIDTTNANVYRNDGTQAQPIWKMLADAA